MIEPLVAFCAHVHVCGHNIAILGGRHGSDESALILRDKTCTLVRCVCACARRERVRLPLPPSPPPSSSSPCARGTCSVLKSRAGVDLRGPATSAFASHTDTECPILRTGPGPRGSQSVGVWFLRGAAKGPGGESEEGAANL